MKKVIIYSSDYCRYCNMAKSLLLKEEIPFEEINVSQNNKLKEEMIKKTGGCRTVPQIFISDQHIGGYDKLNTLYVSRALNNLLK